MNELQKAKLDVETDIAALHDRDDTAAIAEMVEKYRAEITEAYAADKAEQLAELNAGLKYILRAISRAEAAAEEAESPELEG